MVRDYDSHILLARAEYLHDTWTRILAFYSYQSSDGIDQGPDQEIDSCLEGPGLICLSCPRVCSLAVEMKATVITRSIYCINYSN
jgi:hypothetical protein